MIIQLLFITINSLVYSFLTYKVLKKEQIFESYEREIKHNFRKNLSSLFRIVFFEDAFCNVYLKEFFLFVGISDFITILLIRSLFIMAHFYNYRFTKSKKHVILQIYHAIFLSYFVIGENPLTTFVLHLSNNIINIFMQYYLVKKNI